MPFTTTIQPTATFAPSVSRTVDRPSLSALGTAVGDFQLSLASPVLWLLVAALATIVAVLAGIRRRLPDDALATGLTGTLVGEGTDTAGAPERPPTSDLSEDERFVVTLLEEHDGRVRQSRIVEASDWSKSKVSRLLSTMETEGHVEKVTVGRENVIALPGEEPEP